MYQIKTTPTFDSDIKHLDRQVAKRIVEKVEMLADSPVLLKGHLKYMPDNLRGLQRYRIGDWRILFWVDKDKQEIILYAVDHRSRIYKRFGA